jgi:hypothetical protein
VTFSTLNKCKVDWRKNNYLSPLRLGVKSDFLQGSLKLTEWILHCFCWRLQNASKLFQNSIVVDNKIIIQSLPKKPKTLKVVITLFSVEICDWFVSRRIWFCKKKIDLCRTEIKSSEILLKRYFIETMIYI